MNDYMNPSVGLNPYLMRLQMQAQAQAQKSEQQRGPYTRNMTNEGGMTAANEIIYRQFQRPISKIQGNKAFMASTMGFTMAMDYQKQLISTMTSVFKKIDPKELTNVVGSMMGKAGALAYLLPTSLSRVLSSKRDSFEKVFSRELGVVGSLYKTLNLMSLIRYPMRTLPAGLAMLAGFPNLAKLFPRPETLLTGAAVGAYKGAKAVGGVGVAAGGGILNYLTGGAFGKGVGAVTGSAAGGQAVGVLKKVFGGIDSRVLGILSSPVGLSLALAGAQIGLAIWKSIKLSRLLPSRKSPINLERQYSDSMAYDAVLSRLSSLAAVGKIKPDEITAQASLINAQLLMSIERHTSLLRLMAVEMDYKREEREKQGRSFIIDVLGQDPAGMFTQGLNKATGYLHKFIAKFDPITQLINFIISGGKLRPRGEIARLDRTYNMGQYGKNIKEQSKSFGIGLTESRLLTLDSNQIIQMGLSHEDRMEKLTQWQGELLKGIFSENITLRKGFGFTKNVLYDKNEGFKKFLHSINPLNLPGLHALSSLASAPFRAVGAVTKGIWRLPGAIRRMISPDSVGELSLGGGSQPALPVRLLAEGTKGKAEKRAFITGERKFKNGEIDLSSAELVVPGRHGMRVIPLSEFDKRGRKLSSRNSAGKFTSSPNRSLQQELKEVAEKKEKSATSGTQSGILSTLKDMAKSLKNFAIGGVKGAFKGGSNILSSIFSAGKNLIGSGLGLVGGLFKGILGYMVHNPLITIAGGLLLYLVPKLIKSLTTNYEIDWDKIKDKLTGALKTGLEVSNTPIGQYASSGFAIGIPFGIMPGIVGALIGGGVGAFFTLMNKFSENKEDNMWKNLLDKGFLNDIESVSFISSGALFGLKIGSKLGIVPGIVGGLLGAGFGWYTTALKQGNLEQKTEKLKETFSELWDAAQEDLEKHPIIGKLAGIGLIAGIPFGLPGMIAGGMLGGGLGVYLSFFKKPSEGETKSIWDKLSNENSELVKKMSGFAGGLLGFKAGAMFGPVGAVIGSVYGYYIGSMGLAGKALSGEMSVSQVLGTASMSILEDAFKWAANNPAGTMASGVFLGAMGGFKVGGLAGAMWGAAIGGVVGMMASTISQIVNSKSPYVDKDTSAFGKIIDWAIEHPVQAAAYGGLAALLIATGVGALGVGAALTVAGGVTAVGIGGAIGGTAAVAGGIRRELIDAERAEELANRPKGAEIPNPFAGPGGGVTGSGQYTDLLNNVLDKKAQATMPNGVVKPIAQMPSGQTSRFGGKIKSIFGIGKTIKKEENTAAGVNGQILDSTTVTEIWDAAKKSSNKLNIPAEIIMAQWAHETGGFTNRGARELNNFAGIRKVGKKEYQEYNSINDFEQSYSSLIGGRYKDVMGSNTIEDFATGLKRKGYYEDKPENYITGMKNMYSKLGFVDGSLTSQMAFSPAKRTGGGETMVASAGSRLASAGSWLKEKFSTGTTTPGEAPKDKNMFELFGEAWKLAGEYISGIGMPTTEQVKAELAEVKETVMDVASSTTAAVSQAVGNVTSGSNNTNVNQVAGQSGDSGLDNFCLKLFNSLCVVFKEDYVKYPFSAEMFHSNNIS